VIIVFDYQKERHEEVQYIMYAAVSRCKHYKKLFKTPAKQEAKQEVVKYVYIWVLSRYMNLV
jgi:hypothetical protein